MNHLLVLQSDFGLSDGAVAAMEGVVLSVDPSLRIYSLTHDIPPYDTYEASYRLLQAVPFWPKGSVFVSVVDPGVGSAGSQYSQTFHGRDIYSYVGAQIASGKRTFEEVGPEYPVEEIVKLDIPEPVVSEGEITGTIETLDVRFGSLWTNISSDLFQKIHAHYGDLIDLSIYNGSRKVHRSFMTYAETFASVEVGESLIYVNSMNHMAVAINQGSFANAYHIGTRGDWRITMKLAGSRSRTKEASDSTI